MAKRGTLYVGTSGFAYKEWKGVFYPEKTPDKKMLEHYSTILGSVEINYTFRRFPSEASIEGWKSQAHDGFRFTLKASQRITHFKRLVDVAQDVEDFVNRAKGLGDKLGTVLFQLPPNFAYDPDKLKGFVEVLPRDVRFAMEFRHASWSDDEVRKTLEAAGVAYVGAETEEAALGDVPVTAPHVYLRLRKEDYADGELEAWAKRIDATLDRGHDVYCYFKHEGGGVGPAYALKVKEIVG